MTVGRLSLSKSKIVTVATIEGGLHLLVEAREIINDFRTMIRQKSLGKLEPWLERARPSLVVSLAKWV